MRVRLLFDEMREYDNNLRVILERKAQSDCAIDTIRVVDGNEEYIEVEVTFMQPLDFSSVSIGEVGRVKNSAPARYIGEGLGLFISSMTGTDICVDDWVGSALGNVIKGVVPSDDEVFAAASAIRGYKLKIERK